MILRATISRRKGLLSQFERVELRLSRKEKMFLAGLPCRRT